MSFINAQPILDAALATLNACRIPDTPYHRPHAEDDAAPQKPQEVPPEVPQAHPQATAHAVHLSYMLNIFPGRPERRSALVQILQEGLDGHAGLHTLQLDAPILPEACAAVSALECFDLLPVRTPSTLRDELIIVQLPKRLDALPWDESPQSAARQAAAAFGILTLCGEAGPAWEQGWFDWLQSHANADTGLLDLWDPTPQQLYGHWTLLPHLQAYLPLLCTYIHARRPHPNPWRLIDTLLDMLEINWHMFHEAADGRELAPVLALARSLRLTAHRHEEARNLLRRFAHRHIRHLLQEADTGNMEHLAETRKIIATLAELQIALPGFVRTRRPMRPLCDRHVWI